ncbi:MAG: Lactoylglutathione lyase [Microgenomates group bacterium GW2011_GWA2_47_8]|nr:MAG: Lactoylglutathione lyase [Microgenomates group bacterium GW2011_GWA2_47_8]
MFTKLFAICLLVNDFEKSLSFYRDVLELKIKDKEEGFANFVLEGTELAIFQKDAATAMFPREYMKPSGGFLIAYKVGDVALACVDLKKKGVVIFEGQKITPWGQSVAYFHDPDGNIWEVTS